MTVAPGSTLLVMRDAARRRTRQPAPTDPLGLFDLYRDAGEALPARGPAAA
jgi:hypothetical protein